MKTRILTITLLLLVAMASASYAQNAPCPTQGQARPIVARIVKQLGLSQDQVQRIRAIVTKFHQDVQTILKSSATPDDKKTQIKDLRGKAGDAIMATLNADQKAKAQNMHLVELLLAPPRVARAAAGIMFALSQIGLTDQQKTSINGIMDEAKAAAKAIRDDTSLDRAAKMAKLAELRKATNPKVMALLTPEQQDKLKKILARQRQMGKGKKGA